MKRVAFAFVLAACDSSGAKPGDGLLDSTSDTSPDVLVEDAPVDEASEAPSDVPVDAAVDMSPDGPLVCPGMFTLESRGSIAVEPNPWGLTAADIDHDDYPDLVTADGTGVAGTAGAYRNNGNTTFATRQGLADVTGTRAIATADTNADGVRDDVVVLLAGTGQLGPRTSYGDGTFTGTNIALAATGATRVLAADLDGDGRDDALVLHPTAARVTLYRHRPVPDNDWQTLPAFTLSVGATAFSIGELTGDTLPDLAVTYADPPRVELYPGTAAFAWGAPIITTVPATPRDIAIGQLRPSGLPSVVAISSMGGFFKTSIRHFNGTAFENAIDYEAGAQPTRMILADLDSTNGNDIVVLNYGANSIGVFVNQGNGTFSFPSRQFPALTLGPIDVTAADFNHDGRTDLAVLGKLESEIVVFTNRCP